jgi:hypothetical protein
MYVSSNNVARWRNQLRNENITMHSVYIVELQLIVNYTKVLSAANSAKFMSPATMQIIRTNI